MTASQSNVATRFPSLRFLSLTAEQVTPSQVAGCEAVSEITVQTLCQLQETDGDSIILLDVRNADEWAVSCLPQAHFVPFPQFQGGTGVAQVQALLNTWSEHHPQRSPCLVVYCAAGVRSAKALAILETAGIHGLNLQGGIWACPQAMQVLPANQASSYPIQYKVMAKMSNLQKVRISRPQMALSAALVVVGLIGWAGYKVNHDPDKLRPLIQAGLPVQAVEHLPGIGDAVLAAQLPQVNAPQLQQRLDSQSQDLVLVDVRTAEEFQKEHLPNAVNVPVDDIWQGPGVEKVRSLLQGRQLVAYCTSGYRSGRGLVALHKAGIDGTMLKGGIMEWQKEARPVVSEISAK